MFDVFYSGNRPGFFFHEQKATDIEHAKTLSRTRYFWWITYLADLSQWDWLWEPPPWQSHQRHAWTSQHQKDAGVYLIPQQWDRQDTNYHTDKIITRLPDRLAWKLNENIVEDQWDWSWHPDPSDPPYIYVFGNQWHPSEFKASVEYHVPGATERKYMTARTTRLPNYGNHWRVHLPVEEFDYSWEPNPFDPPYIYVFGNQWYSAESEATVEYHVTGAAERKFMHDIVACVAPNTMSYYQHCAVESFDYSWHPDPGDPAYIYVFGNQWWPAETMPTVEYLVPGATERKYMDHPRAQLPERHDNCWHTLEDCVWDYSWVPDPGDPPYIYVFGNQWWPAEKWPTVTYTVPGATERKYMDHPRAQLLPNKQGWTSLTDHRYAFDHSWHPDPGDPPYRYVFGNQWHSAEVMPTLEWLHPAANDTVPTKFVDWPRAELQPNPTFWTLPAGITVDSVDFSWVPDPGDPPYIYQFATQHQKTGGPVYTVPGATEIKYLESVTVKIEVETVPIVEIDHLDGNAGKIANTIKRVRYFDNYRDTLIRIANGLLGQHEFVWICSSVCDYTDFDFTWHPERWQQTMLHVFSSNEQKFGDTFYMHVPSFAERAAKKALLEWYAVNYVPRIQVPRRPMPVFLHSGDSHVDAVKNLDFAAPLALFTVEPHIDQALTTVPLWRTETKTVTPISSGASAVIVPKVAVASIKTQLYDYPHIDKTKMCLKSQPLDIVFISNGEPNSDHNYLQMTMYLANNSRNTNNVHVVKGVNGRVAAYHAAGQKSTTPWFFAVFAKLEVAADFDWSWQPDRLQQPKHYIFHAQNPVNGLVYGHQAMIAYNRQLVLDNPGVGLDFTLDSPHEVVPIVSGVAHYNTSAWSAWRTAFREAIKLKAALPDVEAEYRLSCWLSINPDGHSVVYEDWSHWGAQDGVEYYDSVNGDITELRRSYEWDWLASYAFMRRSLVPDR